MRMQVMVAGMAVAALMALPVMAQDTTGGGQYSEPLRQMLAAAAQGTCDEALMAPGLLAVCNEQIVAMRPMIESLGAVESMSLISAEDTPGGRTETWAVKYASGQTVNWFIGGRQPDGKFASVGTDT